MGYGIAVDSAGNAFVTGETSSNNFPTTPGAYDTTLNGFWDAVVLKLSATGSNLLYSTYLGGTSSNDRGYAIAVDSAGNAYVTGWTSSNDFPTTPGAYDTTLNGWDAVVVKLSATGSNLLYSTYLGGTSSNDGGYAIAVDSAGNAYVTGWTNSNDFPTPGGFDTSLGGGGDAFVAKFSGLAEPPDYGDPPSSVAPGSGTWLWANPMGDLTESYSIGTGTEYDVYAFMPHQTGSYAISTDGLLDSQLRIYNSSGSAITPTINDTIGGEGTTQNFANGNWYYIVVAGYQLTTGSYTLSINGPDIPRSSIATPGPAYAGTASGSIAYGGDLDYYQITAPSGTTTLNLSVVPAAALDTWVKLYSSSGTWLQTINNSGPGGTDSATSIPINAGATYYVGVLATDRSQTGSYTVNVDFNPDDAGDTLALAAQFGTLLSSAAVIRGDQIGNGSYVARDVDLFRFSLVQAGTVTLDVDAQGLGSGLDSYLRLFSAAGTEIQANDDHDGRDPYLSLALAAGTYYVGVSGSPNRSYNPNQAGLGSASSTAGAYALTVTLAGQSGGTWSPTIAATAEYDGNADPNIFGRYLTGSVVPDLLNTIAADVTPSTGFTTSAVVFDSDFDGLRDAGDYTDGIAADGWTWELNVSRLSGNKTLKIWAEDTLGEWSDPAAFTIQTLAAPGWLDPNYTTVTFNASSNEYEIGRLFGGKAGMTTPAGLPWISTDENGQPTWSGFYAGIELDTAYGLDGHCKGTDLSAVFGISMFSVPFELRTEIPGAKGSVHIPVHELLAIDRSQGGWFNIEEINANRRMAKAEREGGYWTNEPQEAELEFTYDLLNVSLTDSLQFSSLSGTFGLHADIPTKLAMPLPVWYSPPLPPPLTCFNLKVTPEFGFGFEADGTMTLGWDGSSVSFAGASFTLTPRLKIGATGEVQVLYGAASGGVEVSGTAGLPLGVQWLAGSGWQPVVGPLTITAELDLVYSLLYGLVAGSTKILEWQWPEGSQGGGNQPAGSTGLPPAIFSDTVAGAGGTATTIYIPVSGDGVAQGLFAIDRSATGVWSAPTVVDNSLALKESPRLCRLSDGRLLAVWTESTTAAAEIPNKTLAEVMGSQEIMYAVRDLAGTWSVATPITNNLLLDDMPTLAAAPSGAEAMLVWRRNSVSDTDHPESSDLYFSRWDGTDWSSPALMADGTSGYFMPDLSYLPNGQALAVWVEDAGASGRDGTARAALWTGTSWGASVLVSDSTPVLPRQWPGVVALSDGRALAFWVERADDGCNLVYATRAAGGSWGGVQTILSGWSLIDHPRCSASADDKVEVVFHALGESDDIYTITRDFRDDGAVWSDPKNLSGGGAAAWLPSADSGSVMAFYNRVNLFGSTQPGLPIAPDDPNLPAGLAGTRTALLPDLSIDGGLIQLGTPPAVLGAANAVQVNVLNGGWLNTAACQAALYNGDPASGGVLIDTQTVPDLVVGASAQVSFNWTPSIAGSHQLYVVVDTAGSIAELREDNNQATVRIGVVASPTLLLDPASDTGTPGDGWTADMTPTFTGTTAAGTAVAVFVDSPQAPVAQATVTGSNYTITLPTLPSGPHTVWAQAYDAAGNPSPFSAPVNLGIDAAIVPVLSSPQIDPNTDTGAIGDAVTSALRPRLVGTAKPAMTVRLFDGVTLLGEVTSGGDGGYAWTPTADLSVGVHQITSSQRDTIGNDSVPSTSLGLVIDTSGAVIRTWDGSGSDGNWMTAANWFGDTAAEPTNSLVFPAGAAPPTINNGFPDDTTFDSLTFSGGGYTIDGHSIVLARGITSSIAAGETTQLNELKLGVRLAAATASVVVDSGALTMSGAITASGTVTKTGPGTLIISGSQNWGQGAVLQIGGTGGGGQSPGSQSAAPDAMAQVDTSTFSSLAENMLLPGSAEAAASESYAATAVPAPASGTAALVEERCLLSGGLPDFHPNAQFLMDSTNLYCQSTNATDVGSPIIPLYSDYYEGGTYGSIDDVVRMTLDGNDPNAGHGFSSLRVTWDGAGLNGYFQFGLGTLQSNRPRAISDFGSAQAVRFLARSDSAGQQLRANVFRTSESGYDSTPIASQVVTLTVDWQDFVVGLPAGVAPSQLHAVQFVLGDGLPAGNRTFWLDEVRVATGGFDPLRVAQSFRPGAWAPTDSPPDTPQWRDVYIYPNLSSTYDNALAIKALLATGDAEARQTARQIADAIIATALSEPSAPPDFPRASYHNFRNGGHVLNGNETPRLVESDRGLGDNAWFGLGLLDLYASFGDANYLQHAREISNWAEEHLRYDGLWGGYRGGFSKDGSAFSWRGTEHNIDLFVLNRRLATLLRSAGDPAADLYAARAQHAGDFVITMFDAQDGKFWTGTDNGDQINTSSVPLDVQMWAVLALSRCPEYAAAIDWSRPLAWAEAHLRATDGPYSGFTFSSSSTPNRVWFEGTAHAAAVYDMLGDQAKFAPIVQTLEYARREDPMGDGRGVVASSGELTDPSFHAVYDERLHVGATAWSFLAQMGRNPLEPLVVRQEGASGAWQDGAWEGGPPAFPSAIVDAAIDNPVTVTINSPQAVHTLTVANYADLQIGSLGTLTAGGPVTLSQNGTMEIGGGGGLICPTLVLDAGIVKGTASFSTAIPITLRTGGGVIDTNGFDLTVDGSVTGSGGFRKRGPGTLALSVANSYTGGTFVEGGTLEVTQVNALPAVGSLTMSGGTVNVNNVAATVTATNVTADSTMLVGTAGTFATGPLTVAANKTLTKVGAGVMIISGPQHWEAGSTLQIGGAGGGGQAAENQSLVPGTLAPTGAASAPAVDAVLQEAAITAAPSSSPDLKLSPVLPTPMSAPLASEPQLQQPVSVVASTAAALVSGSVVPVAMQPTDGIPAAHDAVLTATATQDAGNNTILAQELGWLYAYEEMLGRRQSSEEDKVPDQSVDAVLAMYW